MRLGEMITHGAVGQENADCRSVLSAECISVIRSLTVSGDTVASPHSARGSLEGAEPALMVSRRQGGALW